jgi:cob(I)alamin adenosyltransferase
VLLQYVNRLSDFFFVLARLANRRANVPDVPWVGRGKNA